MDSDAFFTIGKTHKVCQDYAKAGTLERCGAYAIVSDGCSGSPDTDFGARFITMAAVNDRHIHSAEVLRFYLSPLFDATEVARQAKEMIRSPLNPSCIDATCLGIFEEAGGVFVVAAGDGVILAKKRDGTVEVVDIDFNGAPGYPSYLVYPARLDAYYKEGYGERIVTRTLGWVNGSDWDPSKETKHRFTPVAAWVEDLKTEVLDGPFVRLWFPKADYELVMVVSDGIHSFQDAATLERVPMLEIVPNLIGIKSYAGEFVARRVIAFEKLCAKKGWHHNDDLGVAAVYLGEVE